MIDTTALPPPMTGNGQDGYRAFLKSMTRQDTLRCAGEWIAVASGEIAAHGNDPERVHEEGCKAGKGGGAFMHCIYSSPDKVPIYYRVRHEP